MRTSRAPSLPFLGGPMSKADELLSEPKEDIVAAYNAGVDAYWAGECPDGWDAPDANDNPYLAGWNHAASQENRTNFFQEEELDD